jgi:predicted secreted Zn-dependent protease
MRPAILLPLLAAMLPFAPARAGDWKPVEKIETYAISGQTAPELYASIGEKGPVIGKDSAGNLRRAIAHTFYKLTWQRDYDDKATGGACVLKTARPKLIITYTLPKPATPMPAGLQKRWDSFAAGLAAHEKVHGGQIVDMVQKIEALSVGFTIADDPGCKKIRTELTARLAELSQAQRQASRDFDRVEFGPGGNLQKLVLAFVTGE